MNKRIKAIIIDDEERARRVLNNMIEEFCPEIEVVGVCENVPKGVLEINRKQPDVVFLDIEMPEYSGFELLEFFRDIDFEIIFVTAYSEYAIRAFEVSAIDYVLKPIRIDKLEIAVEKLKNKLQSATMFDRLETLKENIKSMEIKKIAVPVADGLIFVKIDNISHIDADGSYVKIWLSDGSNIFVSKKLKYFESLLINKKFFYRTHRSHLVNISFVKKYSRHESLITLENNQTICVARSHKSKFEDKLKNMHSTK